MNAHETSLFAAALLAAAALAGFGLSGCSGPGHPASNDAGDSQPAPTLQAPAERNTAGNAAPSSSGNTAPGGRSVTSWRRLATELSEPSAAFFSDNFISNETSYLQVTQDIDDHIDPGGVYIGVGPEQNFSYIALTKPDWAYVIDIRRDNMLLHLLYKAAFDLARDRAELLTLLTARPYDTSVALPSNATIDQVLEHAGRLEGSDESYRATHARLQTRIVRGYGFELDAADRHALEEAHRAFYRGGLDLRFKLKTKSFRKYPSLREILTQKDPSGAARGFLASKDSFRYVQRMQREHRIVPLVGDFAGDRAMPGLAAHLERQKLLVRTFYVSNVEQYLLAGGVWWKWQRNVAAFPVDARSTFIRAYLDQGKPHPKQMSGHRTATTLQRMQVFNARKKPYPSLWHLSTDGKLALGQ